jgi:hypothetical protein
MRAFGLVTLVLIGLTVGLYSAGSNLFVFTEYPAAVCAIAWIGARYFGHLPR